MAETKSLSPNELEAILPKRSSEFLISVDALDEINEALKNALECSDLDAQQDEEELRAAIETLKTARGNLGDTYA